MLAGLIAITGLSLATDVALRALRVFPPFGTPMSDTLFLLATVHQGVFALAGSYLTARLAPDWPMEHALALGVVGRIASIAGAAVLWVGGPIWYPLALIELGLPCAWAGGKLGATRCAPSPPTSFGNL